MEWLISLISAVVKTLFPAIMEQVNAPDTGRKADDADPALRDSLLERVRKHESDLRGDGINRKDWTRR